MAFFRAEGSRMVSWLRKNGFFLRIFFFWGPICYKISKIPKISIYAYLTILMSSSTMCRSRNSWKLVVGVAGFEMLELYTYYRSMRKLKPECLFLNGEAGMAYNCR